MERPDIHNYDARVKNALRRIQQSDINEKNKMHLERFYKFSVAQQISKGRIAKHLWHLLTVARVIKKDFAEATKIDIENVMVDAQERGYKDSTIRDYKVVLKKFYNWLREYPPKQYPPEVVWLKTADKNEETRDPSSDLTVDEIKALARAAEHPRDKALIWVLYETAARIGELLSVQLKHLSFGQICTVKIWGEKVKKWKEPPLVDARADLATWLDIHPYRDDPEAYLFVSIGKRNHGKPVCYTSVVSMLRKAAKKCGITKPVNPHSFRHSRLSFLGDYLSDAQECDVAGWRQGSKQARTYVRPKRTKQAILGIYGINIDTQQETKTLTPKTCNVCTMINAPESKYCRHCGTVIELETAVFILKGQKQFESIEKRIYTQQEVVEQALRALQQNEAVIKNLESTYPKYFELARKVVKQAQP